MLKQILLITFLVSAAPAPSQAQTSITLEEAPPKPEYPYPGADDPDAASQPPARQAAPVRAQGRRVYPRSVEQAPDPRVERPVQIDGNGNYRYSDKIGDQSPKNRHGQEKPIGSNRAGQFFYDQNLTPPKFSNRPGVEKPMSISNKGEYQYQTPRGKNRRSASFRIGFIEPPAISNPLNGARFRDIYGVGPHPILFADYEWRIFSNIGRLGVKFGSGFLYANGQGRFRRPQAGEDPIADENFSFITLPNQLTAVYKFQYADNQILVPYVEGGAGYFTFVEIRDDNQPAKWGGAAVGVAAGGVNILMDWIDKKAIRQLSSQYGINHMWLTAEFRAIVGLNPNYDFTSNAINAGFMMDF